MKRIGSIALCCFSAIAINATAGIITTTYDTSLTSPPGYINGTGSPNTNFARSTDGTTEEGLSAVIRGVGPVDPGPDSNTYIVPTGVGPTGKALWNFQLAENTEYSGGTVKLGDLFYLLNVFDVTTGIQGALFDWVRLIPDNTGYGPSGKTSGVDLTTEWVAQNSESNSFAGFMPGFNPNAPDTYRVTISTYNSLAAESAGQPSNSDTILIKATVPEPGTWGLGLVSMGGLALLAKRRRTI